VQDSPILQVCNKNTQDSLFSIAIPTKECLKIEAEGYNLVDLPEKGSM
jgi:hypothetical protein